MHEQFLLAALEQARQGQGSCAPNPSVGAVAVQDGKIIAQACHKGAGTPHAEQLLLAQFPPNLPDVRVYITLEPCNHWGRTPPCVEKIISHGIKDIIFSYLDPNPIVAKNKSSEQLRQHGIRVLHVPLQAVNDFYQSYTYWIKNNRPRVTVKMAQTLDGKIAGAKGERVQLTNALCERFTHEKRAQSDVILTSARTIIQDNPQLNVRLEETRKKPLAIIDSHCRLNPEFTVFQTAEHCHLYYVTGKPFQTNASCSFYPMPEKNGKMDLFAVINHLGRLGFHDVWVEAGSEIFNSLHFEGLVHRTYLYIAPQVLGPALTAYPQKGLFDKAHTVSWHEMGDNMIACLDWQEDLCLPV